MPGWIGTSLTLGASGAEYTAPADGWFYIVAVTSGVGGWVYVIAKNFHMVSNAYADQSSVTIFCPVLKGDSIRFDYPNLRSKSLRFIYANGSQPA